MEEEELGFGGSKKQTSRSAKTGRRAKKSEPEPAHQTVDDGGAEEEVASTETRPDRGPDAPPRPSRRMSGWGDMSNPTSASRRRDADGDVEDERLRQRSPDKDEDSDEGPDIPVIPDLEDQQDEDLTTQVAMAPNVAVNRVATYRELDNDLLRHAAFLTLDNDIDLKLLSKGLSAEADVQEEDKVWEWDRLFTEVTSELLVEWERKEVAEEDATGA